MDQTLLDQITPFSGFDQAAQGALVSGAQYGTTMQQVKTQYTTAVAVQKPRSLARLTSNVLQEAALAGAGFYYRWAVKDKNGQETVIQGPSIDLAMCLVRNYGNCVLDVEVEEGPSHYLFKGVLVDLESGFTCPRLFRQRKGQALGRFDKDRQEDITFQIGQSKALRNAIVHAMPSWLIEQAIEAAYIAELRSIKPENIAAARAKCIKFFQGHGV
ncbi:MAG TPA: hypothetical protein VJ019_03510, partial [Aestuariivirga sp.]|nr:hypothetical protein [Aestuariivirga sp.]